MNEQRFTARQRWVLGLTAAASFIAVMDGMVVTTALDTIRRDLSAPLSQLHWTMTAYSLSFAALLMAGAANRVSAGAVALTYRLTTIDEFCEVPGVSGNMVVPCSGMDERLDP